jgi:hypothetical protein
MAADETAFDFYADPELLNAMEEAVTEHELDPAGRWVPEAQVEDWLAHLPSESPALEFYDVLQEADRHACRRIAEMDPDDPAYPGVIARRNPVKLRLDLFDGFFGWFSEEMQKGTRPEVAEAKIERMMITNAERRRTAAGLDLQDELEFIADLRQTSADQREYERRIVQRELDREQIADLLTRVDPAEIRNSAQQRIDPLPLNSPVPMFLFEHDLDISDPDELDEELAAETADTLAIGDSPEDPTEAEDQPDEFDEFKIWLVGSFCKLLSDKEEIGYEMAEALKDVEVVVKHLVETAFARKKEYIEFTDFVSDLAAAFREQEKFGHEQRRETD